MHGEEMVAVAFFSIFIVWVVAHYCAKCFKTWQVTSLKRDMVARGYTAQEIIDVVAGSRSAGATAGTPDVPPAKPIKHPAYSP